MTHARFVSDRQELLATLRDWLARGAAIADVREEVAGTVSAMNQLVRLAEMDRAARPHREAAE